MIHLDIIFYFITFATTPNIINTTAETICLTENIYHEASSETIKGQYAVGGVTLNRTSNKQYPNTICNTVKQKHKNVCQFSWVCQKKKLIPKTKADLLALSRALAISIDLLYNQRQDYSYGATHFYHKDIIEPEWAKEMTVTTEIGDHIFLKE